MFIVKIYVASSWRNNIQPHVVEALREQGFEVYDFKNPEPGNHGFGWDEIDTGWQTWTPEEFRTALSHPIAEAGFGFDMKALRECDVCVLVLTSGRSAHLEAGYAIGAGKPTVIMLQNGEPELMYKMTPHICLDIQEVVECVKTINQKLNGGYKTMTNELIFDAFGKPSVMVRVPKFYLDEVIAGAPHVPHPAFVIDGAEIPEIYVSKYQNTIAEGRAYSLPYQQPAVNVNFDEAKKACESKGKGWHLLTNAEWAAIALWAKKNGTLSRGNNNWGSNYQHSDEKGVCFDGGKVLTGSGPDTWSHDHTPQGIFDLNGNVWEWVGGLRLLGGEIQVIAGNNAAKHVDQSPESSEWQPVLVDGKSIKYSETEDGMKVTTEEPEGDWNGCRFTDLETDIEVPDVMKALGLFPADDTELTDYFWADVNGERLPIRGGHWAYGSNAGVFNVDLNSSRAAVSSSIGFRSAFVNL